ncbi:hypothetical protein NITHO_1260013 [Nitrolancea hollandica Lb]|uniref:Uncharacterized protein n=1 Tax=Nitrolancea hollandica Lb TaxID=1129897 RepID=I4ECW8_9BACT|nr:hypothetical protein NITHO_1260013 [Nitrolancea hollandica Lb]
MAPMREIFTAPRTSQPHLRNSIMANTNGVAHSPAHEASPDTFGQRRSKTAPKTGRQAPLTGVPAHTR